MRGVLLALGAALLASGCGEEKVAQDSGQADRQLARDDLQTNDLTAIDAASGADANMAADIDIANMALDEEQEEGGNTSQRRTRSQLPRSRATNPPPVEREDEATPPDNAPETEDGAN